MNTYPILGTIRSPADVKALPEDALPALAEEVRAKLLETVSNNGGHLASNLGAVELTIALHRVFDSPRDQIVFDVGHQCYTHKLLTGRFAQFETLRRAGGLSGFCRPNESEHDVFYSGHSSTSVSAGLGLATAKKLEHDEHYVISVIGDGSFTGGMVYEALNNGGRSGTKHILVLNDNNMSISENVGSLAKYLAVIRSTPQYYTFKASTERTLSKIPFGTKIVHGLYDLKTQIKNKIYAQSNFFEDLGYRYMGPIDGHRIDILCDALQAAKSVNGPVLLHVITEKGKGYAPSESDPSSFHGVAKFDVSTGAGGEGTESFSDFFGNLLCEMANRDARICAVTAAMGLPTRLGAFETAFPDRFFDVGIAEEHAVTFSAGLAKNGLVPVFAVYSTFLQRCYDQLVHDTALQNAHVVFAVDRAGFVGADGETHQGLMDVSFLSSIPNFKIFSPYDFTLLSLDLSNAINAESCPVAVRYPRGGAQTRKTEKLKRALLSHALYGDENAETVLVTYGRLAAEAVDAADALQAQEKAVLVLALNQIKPLPQAAIELLQNKKRVFFFEEGLRAGGIGEKTAAALLENGFTGTFRLIAVEDRFVPQGTVEEQLRQFGLDSKSMVETIGKEM